MPFTDDLISTAPSTPVGVVCEAAPLPILRVLRQSTFHREFALGFAEKKVDVLRHDDVAGHETAASSANALQCLLERISSGDGIQQLHRRVAGEGDEVQAVLALDRTGLPSIPADCSAHGHPSAKNAGKVGQPILGFMKEWASPL
ncbi:MAG TPA: hypothetical protein VMS18_01315 [Candidatus Binatia bacterium]|nr:hypothetical protein [Candidatus Binatia bacterium]